MGCQSLRNVPEQKLKTTLAELDLISDLNKKTLLKKLYQRYYEANVPFKYWKLEMNKHFFGDINLKNIYEDVVKDIPTTYNNGTSICLAGSFGVGKSLTVTNILKRAVEKGYSGQYVNLTDIISAVRSPESYDARKELIKVDFLVIDEFDPRYIANENSSDFFGRVLEDIIRNRFQNKLPIFMCTNALDPVNAFTGTLKQSISSLMNYVKVIPVLGSDFRKKENNE